MRLKVKWWVSAKVNFTVCETLKAGSQRRNSTLQNLGIFPAGVKANLLLLNNCSVVLGGGVSWRQYTMCTILCAFLSWIFSQSQRERGPNVCDSVFKIAWVCGWNSAGSCPKLLWRRFQPAAFRRKTKRSAKHNTDTDTDTDREPSSSLICLGRLLPRHWTKPENCSKFQFNAWYAPQRW